MEADPRDWHNVGKAQRLSSGSSTEKRPSVSASKAQEMISPPPPIPGDIVLDVSHWEGVIDWEAVHSAGVRKAVVKLTDGRNFGDPLGAYNARAGREAGIKVSFYHYCRPNVDAVEQLRVFSAALYGAHWSSEEEIALDIETTSGLGLYLMRQFVLKAYRFALSSLNTVPEAYTRMTFWRRFVGPINWEAEGLPTPALWTADYGWYGDGRPLLAPRWIAESKTWRTWRRWQYTDRGKVPGVTGAVDLNVEA